MRILLLDQLDASEWDLSVRHAVAPHVLQSCSWGEFKSQTGWDAFYLVSRDGRTTHALAVALLRRFLFSSVRVLYVPRGPLIYGTSRREQEEEFRSALQYIKQIAHDYRVVWAKVSPEIEADRVWAKSALEEEGYVYSAFQVQHRCTFRIDLTRPLEENYRRLESRTRYAIRKGEEAGLEFRECIDVEDLLAFHRLYAQTLARAGVPAKSFAELKRMAEVLHPAGCCHLFAVYIKNLMVAGAFVLSFGGRLWYMYGGSLRSELGANSGSYLHWKIIEWASVNGYREYDLQGIPCEVRSGDALFGVYLFKRGFGGRRVEMLGEYDYFPHGFVKALSPTIFKIYATLARLRFQWRALLGFPHVGLNRLRESG